MRRMISLTILLVAFAAPSSAQRITASLRGTVTDSTGAVVPGATVTVKNENSGFSRTTITNGSGSYSFGELPTGPYTVEVSLTGFKSVMRTGIILDVADVRGEDVRLEAGALSETVTVESPALAIQTIGGEVAGLVTGEQVRELPLNGRNFLQLGTLMPGVSQGDGFNTKDRGLMSGIELAHSLARTNEDMRLVVMSGHPPTEMALPHLRRPAAFLAKPFTPSELRQQMYAVLADVTDQQP